jgi:hypothetical protein
VATDGADLTWLDVAKKIKAKHTSTLTDGRISA